MTDANQTTPAGERDDSRLYARPPTYWPDGRRQYISPEDRAEWRALIGKPRHIWSRHTVRDLLDVLEQTERKLALSELAHETRRLDLP